jgi:hypothetical protein
MPHTIETQSAGLPLLKQIKMLKDLIATRKTLYFVGVHLRQSHPLKFEKIEMIFTGPNITNIIG